MRELHRYIAWLLLLLLGITFMPFNALHHHAEDEHELALLKHHIITENHHCELDDQFCQQVPNEHCAHPMHVAKTMGKCFTCEFHFVKHYTNTSSYFVLCRIIKQDLSQPVILAKLSKAFILISNKGPPASGSITA